MENLNPALQRLLDPIYPLPAGVDFYASKPGWLKLIVSIIGAGTLLVFGVFLIAAHFAHRPTTDRNPTAILGFGILCLIVSVMLLLVARRHYGRLNVGTGKPEWRSGLFLLSDALFLREGARYSLVPRKRIIETCMVGAEVLLVYRDDEGIAKQLLLPTPLGGLSGLHLLGVVRQWLGTSDGMG